MAATKDQFLAAKPKMLSVDLPDLGITVNVLKGTLATIRQVQGIKEGELAKQASLMIADDDGQLLFTADEDINKLESILTMSDANLLMEKWRELNGISKEQVEQASKNSNASTTDASASA